MALATTRRIRFPLTASRLPTSKAKCSPTRPRSNRSSRGKSFRARHPAEYGGKTSVVIVATTRSGQGVTTPHGGVTTSYGSFRTSNVQADLAYGGTKWGNFISVGGLNSGRFLDPPEFVVMHDKGNEENLFDRVDYQFSSKDSMHVNLGFTRSWFQTPNSFDSELATPWNGVVVANGGLDPNGNVVGPADQRSQIKTFNIAPSWTRLINPTTVFNLGAFVRRDGYNYYPSANPFADLGAPGLQSETVSQRRTLTNVGLRSDVSCRRGSPTAPHICGRLDVRVFF